MSLSKRQQNWILKSRKLSPQKIAKKLNADIEEIQEFLDSNQPKPVPKYFYLILFLIPIVFVILLEVSLRIFDYGNEFRQWIPVTEERLGLNPDIGSKYFTKTKALPESIQDTFKKDKPENSFRVFVLGGSSAAGYPFMPLGSFSRYIDQRLKHVYPDAEIEVVNISLTAVNSYTIRDFIPGVLEQNPDLILIYAGHNEFYGALGIGSMESIGTSRNMVNLILYMNKYRTTQLVRDFLSWTIGLFAGEEETKTGTLMSRMAEDQSIALNSETYKAGIEQFRENMRDVIKLVKDKNVNLVIGNLAANIQDQEPFISKKTETLPAAHEIFSNAESEFQKGNFKRADSLYRYAKDLDMLRFRASEELNNTIYTLGNEYNIPIVNVDSVFVSNSPERIIGNNLMTDHLHPTLRGYQLMGDAFYTKMVNYDYLPEAESVINDQHRQDSLTVNNYYFSSLDSVTADYKIKMLKNDWPYLKDLRKKKSNQELLNPKSKIDSIAYSFVVEDEPWIDIQQEAANYYLRKQDYTNYTKYMDILLYQYPYLSSLYDKVVKDLVTREKYDIAYSYALRKHEKSPDAFSAKWLGIINLSNGKVNEAEKYLIESMGFNSNDEQVIYNLAGVYVQKNNYEEALNYVNQALQINSNYPAAQSLKNQLESALKNN